MFLPNKTTKYVRMQGILRARSYTDPMRCVARRHPTSRLTADAHEYRECVPVSYPRAQGAPKQATT
jgi:hypothetical protein